jgi:hypothetical protein
LRKARAKKKNGTPSASPFIDRVNARLLENGTIKIPLSTEKIE